MGLFSSLFSKSTKNVNPVNPVNSTEIRVKSIVAKILCISIDKINNSDFIDTDLGADSLEVLEILIDIEREFNVSIPDEKTDGICTIDDLIKEVNSYL